LQDFPKDLGEGKIYKTVDQACIEGTKLDIETYNSTQTDVIPYGVFTMKQTQVNTAAYVGNKTSKENPAAFACMVRFTSRYTFVCISGDCSLAPPPVSDYVDSTVERILISEARLCDQSQGWQQHDEATCAKPINAPSCNAPDCGNPTSTATGGKKETFTLHQLQSGARAIPIALRYGNQFHLVGGLMLGEPSWFVEPADRRLRLDLLSAPTLPRVASARGAGFTEEFHAKPDGSFKSFDPQLSLTRTGIASKPWLRTDYQAQTLEYFDSLGRLLQLRYFGGGGFDLAYADAQTFLPQSMTSTTGPRIQFTYTGNRLTSLKLPNDLSITLAYKAYTDEAKNISGTYLQKITYPDGAAVSFDYSPGIAIPRWLTVNSLSTEGKAIWVVPPSNPSGGGNVARIDPQEMGRAFFNLSQKIDETGQLYANFSYDNDGRVLVSQHAGSTNQYRFDYQNDTTTRVTQPLGVVSTFNFSVVNEQMRLSSLVNTSTALPGGAHTVAYGYDALGNITEQIDANPNNSRVRCMKVDPATNRPAVMLEGLSSCPANAADYTPEGEARKTSTQWHPDWRLPTRMAAPGRITTWVYNGQPDPTAGNAVASCAPASAKLPNNKPIAVVCKVVVQATTDANGSLGFAAAAQPGVPARTGAWTYNQWGQVLTADGPRTDVADRTTYTYHAATAFSCTGANAVGVTQGDLASITNAAGQTTRFTQYDKHGHWREAVDANGITTSVAYDARQRPTSITTAGEVTTFTYDKVGQLVRTTAPDGSYVQHTYDAAHRLIASADNLGNRVDYTLDNAGNRTAERYKDPSGSLRRQVQHQFDALGRLTNTVGAP
jgi:YD repeat-containing protein